MPKPARSRSALGKANLTKSKVMERTKVAYLRVSGWPGAERTARPGYTVAGRSRADLGDTDGTPGLTWQDKNVARITPAELAAWLADTDAQRAAAGADYGILVVKRAGHAHPSTWWTYLWLADFLRLTGAPVPTVAGFEAHAPVRLELGALLPLLHAAGYGTPPAPPGPCPAQVSGQAQDCRCGDPAACGERYALGEAS